ncbi:hypothetical protein OG937_04960 [Streptomyces sp. NBC_00510]
MPSRPVLARPGTGTGPRLSPTRAATGTPKDPENIMPIPTTKSGGLLNNAFVAVRRLQPPATASGTGRHRGRPAGERITSIGVRGMGAHRRPLDTPGSGDTATQA